MKKVYDTKKLIYCPYCSARLVLLMSTIKYSDITNTYIAQVECGACGHRGPRKIGSDFDVCVKQAEEIYK